MTNPIESLIRRRRRQGRDEGGRVQSQPSRTAGCAASLPERHPRADDAELTLTDLAVEGAIPPELDGRYVRIGSNPLQAPNAARTTGSSATAWCTASQPGRAAARAGTATAGSARARRQRALGEEPAPGPRHGGNDTVNTNVLGHAGKRPGPRRGGRLTRRARRGTRHGAHDPFGGSLHGAFSATRISTPPAANCARSATSPPTRRRSITSSSDATAACGARSRSPVSHGPSIHDCMITPRYVLVFDLPVTFSMKSLLAGQSFPYVWNPSIGPAWACCRAKAAPTTSSGATCRRATCSTRAMRSRPATAGSSTWSPTDHVRPQHAGPDSRRVTFERWTIDPATKSVARRVVDDHPQEFPRPDERRLGRPYRYAYAVAQLIGEVNFLSDSHLIRHDLRPARARSTSSAPVAIRASSSSSRAAPTPRRRRRLADGLVIDAGTQTTDFSGSSTRATSAARRRPWSGCRTARPAFTATGAGRGCGLGYEPGRLNARTTASRTARRRGLCVHLDARGSSSGSRSPRRRSASGCSRCGRRSETPAPSRRPARAPGRRSAPLAGAGAAAAPGAAAATGSPG